MKRRHLLELNNLWEGHAETLFVRFRCYPNDIRTTKGTSAMLSQNQFKVINALNKQSELTQRELSSETGLSLATVNATCKECEAAGLIENGDSLLRA